MTLNRIFRFTSVFVLALLVTNSFPQQPDILNPETGWEVEKNEPATIRKQKPRKQNQERVQPFLRHRHSHSATIALGKDVTIGTNERTDGVIAIGGNVTVDGEVDEGVYVLFGSAKVNGTINDDLFVLLGPTDLGSKAAVHGDVYSIGGPFHADREAIISGESKLLSILSDRDFLEHFRWFRDWFVQGFLLGRPLPHQLSWGWFIAAAFILFYVLFSFVFPRPVLACTEALARRPAAAFFLGLLSFTLLGPVIFLLIVSVVGIPIIPVLLLAVLGLMFFGKAGVYCYAGQQVSPSSFSGTAVQLPLMVLIGAVFFCLLYMVPLLGFIAWGTAMVMGLGSVLLASFGGRRRESPVMQPVLGPTPLAANLSPGFVPGSSTSDPSAQVATEPIFFPRVGFWRRLMATALDFILLGLLIVSLKGYFLLLWAAYHMLMWSWKGTTIGGIVMGIKVVRTDGAPLSFPVAMVRSLSSFFSAILLFVGFFWAGWDREKQAWHDKIAGTAVVRVPRGISLV